MVWPHLQSEVIQARLKFATLSSVCEEASVRDSAKHRYLNVIVVQHIFSHPNKTKIYVFLFLKAHACVVLGGRVDV